MGTKLLKLNSGEFTEHNVAISDINAVSAGKIIVSQADGSGGFNLVESSGLATDLAFKNTANTFTQSNTFNNTSNFNSTAIFKAGSDASKASSIVPATDSDMSVGAGWSGTNWTIGGGVYTHVAGANNATLSSVAPLASTMYEVGIKVTTTTAGSLTVSLGGTVAIQNLGAFLTVSALTFYLSILTTNTANLVLIPDANWVGTVDDVTIKLVTAGATNNINRNSTSTAGVEIRECAAVSSEGVGFRNQRFSTGGGNTSLGYDSMYKNTIGTQNVALGYKALSEASNCNNTVAIGYQACMNAATVDRSVAIGTNAMMNCVGTLAPFSYGNVAIGYEALLSHPYVQDNVALGYKTGRALLKGRDNMLIGSNAAFSMTDGSFNVMIGTNAGYFLTGVATNSNIFIGSNSGYSLTAGQFNTAIGQDTFRSATASTSRTINLGYSAGYYNDVSGAFVLDSYFRSSKQGEIQNSLFYGLITTGVTSTSGKATQTLRINAFQWIAAQVSGTSTQEIVTKGWASGTNPPVESTNAYSSIRWTSTAAHKQKYDLFMNVAATDTAPVSVHSVSDTGAHIIGSADNLNVHDYRTPTQTTVGAAGAASALPATPTGYMELKIKGSTYVMPFYAKN